jgi:hypothetical protein
LAQVEQEQQHRLLVQMAQYQFLEWYLLAEVLVAETQQLVVQELVQQQRQELHQQFLTQERQLLLLQYRVTLAVVALLPQVGKVFHQVVAQV